MINKNNFCSDRYKEKFMGYKSLFVVNRVVFVIGGLGQQCQLGHWEREDYLL